MLGTILWASKRMLAPDALHQAARRLQDDPHPLPRRFAAHLLHVTA